jgi:hypothetical protein
VRVDDLAAMGLQRLQRADLGVGFTSSSGLGSAGAGPFDVRFAPNSGAKADIAEGPSWAISGLMRRSNCTYSITSSASCRYRDEV